MCEHDNICLYPDNGACESDVRLQEPCSQLRVELEVIQIHRSEDCRCEGDILGIVEACESLDGGLIVVIDFIITITIHCEIDWLISGDMAAKGGLKKGGEEGKPYRDCHCHYH